MIKWLHKSILLITGIFFALAILEIHGADSQNTFFDHDDTYIQRNNQNVELNAHVEKQNDFFRRKKSGYQL